MAFGLPQQELADLAGCSRVFVMQVEAGKATVRLDSLIRLGLPERSCRNVLAE
ncbi:MAG: hypothetical protein ACO1SV_18500 [Fimbriimonas sp.]